MINSGDTIDFKGAHKFLVDKHSTGGVGDKTTIALAPVLAALGMGTAKLSGKGLGHTGGTIDKFESIKGFKFSETREELIKLVNETGIGIMGYSEKIVPMDKKLYSLRDVTGTVSSIPLIASSIMSKKLAVHADAIILDVKVGSGAFMKTFEEAKKLAETMYKLGKLFNRNIVCMLSNMDEPLGCAVGNSLEVIEAIETLKGRGPKKFEDLIVKLSAQALKMKGDVKTLEEGIIIVKEVITSGRALENLEKFIEASGGNPKICSDYSLLEVAKEVTPYLATEDGYISHIAADEIGRAAMMLGAGRSTKDDIIDHSVGLIMNAKIGTYVKKDHTVLKATATVEDIKKLCREAKEHNFYSVCVNSSYVKISKEELKGTDVKVCSVIGFPLGAMSKEAKIFEAKECIKQGATEIDMVINIGFMKSGMYKEVEEEIKEIKEAIGNNVLKVIIENCYLTETEKKLAVEMCVNAMVDFVKTSTGFGTGGATLEDLQLMKSIVKDKIKIKAAGGVKDLETAIKFIEAGANRLGTSSGVQLVTVGKTKDGEY
ncbi:hypothetical protein GJ496_004575 [Pomphorhynchus laevis]|nr:hypothetical protein GJ496_004575 [Pomphorhynchus laevis]